MSDYILKHYAATLTTIEQAAPQPSVEQVLDLLLARDAVHRVLTDPTEHSTERLVMVLQLDSRLKKQSNFITQAIQLADLRSSFHPTVEAWWWFLEPPPHQWDRFDWLWNALSITCLTTSLSLIVDVSSRFLSGGPDTLGAFAITVQSVLTLLAGGGALTKAGQEAIEQILTNLNIPKHFQHEVKTGFAALVLLGLISFRLLLPQIASAYNQRGLKFYSDGQLASAQSNYERAIKLDPDNVEARYNLGVLYEDLQDFSRARTEYQIAAQGELASAYNNLARLYILNKDHSPAIPLLMRGLSRTKDKEVKYLLQKNLGWVRLNQKRYSDAENILRDAISLNKERAAAYCLLAQVLEGKNDKKNALIEWENCLRYASSFNRDEDDWINLAQQRLNSEGEK